jgi:AmmeMemoRadiSam system protein B
MAFSNRPRPAVAAGRFYPGDEAELRPAVRAFLDAAAQYPADCGGKKMLAAMVPHAGYVFSGALAGLTLARAALEDTVVILAPNHTGRGQRLAVWNGGAWLTPLGAVPVDRELAAALTEADGGFSPDEAAHQSDHAIEVVLPFIQVLRPAARIVPVCVGGGSFDALRAAGSALAAILRGRADAGRPVSLVVSSDMSHYLPHETAVAQDGLALEKIRVLDPEGLYATVRVHKISMCGALPMTMAMVTCRALGAQKACVTAYATSGQTGRAYGADMKKVVGYAGALIPAPDAV